MNTTQIIAAIIAALPPNCPASASIPGNWVKSTSKTITFQGVNYIQEGFQCMENHGFEPAGVIADVFLNQAHDAIFQLRIRNIMAEVEDYGDMIDNIYGQGIDNLRK